MSLEIKEIFEFGEFRLDADERTIERIDGKRNGKLAEKAFQTLVLLVRRRGHLVLKDELIRYVWPETIVEDNNLEKSIHQLRHFLGETPDGGKYIETVRKHGYRFVGDVKVTEVSASWLPESFRLLDDVNGSTGTIAEPATYPKIVSRDSVEIAAAGVREARVIYRKLLVSTTVVLALIGGVVGTRYYFFVPPAVEENAVEFQAKRGTNSAEAHQLYMMAMNLSEERGTQNALKSLEYLERAIALDPNYSHAWAAKALTHRDLAAGVVSGQEEHYQRSMNALGRALAIDPNESDAYSALCHNKNRYEYDVAGAETACKRAVELDPGSPVAHKTYSNFLYSRGRFDEAIVEIKTAMDLQPVSYRNQQMFALTLYFARRYDEAETQWKRLIELNPNHSYIHGRLVRVLADQGKELEAFEYLIQMLTIQNKDVEKLQRFKTAYQTEGWRGVVIEQIKTAETDADPDYFQLACLHAKIGENDKAFQNLEKAYQQRNFQIAIIQVEPQLDSLRDDPRFAALTRRIYGQ